MIVTVVDVDDYVPLHGMCFFLVLIFFIKKDEPIALSQPQDYKFKSH